MEKAIPMVCFCDIPLSQIGNHIMNYGGYALGLSKEWEIKNGINPVMYSTKDSISSKTILTALNKIESEEKQDKINLIDQKNY